MLRLLLPRLLSKPSRALRCADGSEEPLPITTYGDEFPQRMIVRCDEILQACKTYFERGTADAAMQWE